MLYPFPRKSTSEMIPDYQRNIQLPIVLWGKKWRGLFQTPNMRRPEKDGVRLQSEWFKPGVGKLYKQSVGLKQYIARRVQIFSSLAMRHQAVEQFSREVYPAVRGHHESRARWEYRTWCRSNLTGVWDWGDGLPSAFQHCLEWHDIEDDIDNIGKMAVKMCEANSNMK